jgi:hypothetical protein
LEHASCDSARGRKVTDSVLFVLGCADRNPPRGARPDHSAHPTEDPGRIRDGVNNVTCCETCEWRGEISDRIGSSDQRKEDQPPPIIAIIDSNRLRIRSEICGPGGAR